MKKIILRVVLGVIVIAALFSGWRWATEWRYLETTDDAYVDGDIVAMSSKLAAHVVEVAVGDNQTVKAGDLLVRLDDRDYRAKVAEARAVLAARQAELAQFDDKIAVQNAVQAQAGAGISAAKADLTRSRQDLERAKSLVREDFVSRQRFDAQAAEAAKADAALRGSSAQADAARRQKSVLETERDVAQAQIEQAQAQLEQALADLQATEIRAPHDGIIGNRAVRVGQFAMPGRHLLSVAPLGEVWIDANFKETQMARLHQGQKATIKIDAFPNHPLTGAVQSFSPASGSKFSLLPPENATGNFTKIVQRVPVRIVFEAVDLPPGRLVPGMSAVVSVDVRTGESRNEAQ